jgi:hypothetical protein
MVQDDQSSVAKKPRLLKWALVLCVIVALLWAGAYLLGVQIYDAALRLTH